MSDFYNRNGSRFKGDVIAWAQKFEKENRQVALDILLDGKVVSTVFLGIDHNFTKQGIPLIFETVVFPNKGNEPELECERYATEEEALIGHKKLVKKYLKTL